MGSLNENESIISKKEKANLVKGKWTLVLFGIGLLIFYFYNFFNTTRLTQESAAQFGDYLGGTLNPILGFATVALLVWSIQIQLRELKLTRYEMKKNTQANREQASELHTQNKHHQERYEKDNEILKLQQLQQLFSEQRIIFNYYLQQPIGLIDKGRLVITNEVLYASHAFDRTELVKFLNKEGEEEHYIPYQINSVFKQCVWILQQMLTHCHPSVCVIKGGIGWLMPYIGICFLKALIKEEQASEYYKAIENSILSSRLSDIEIKGLINQLAVYQINPPSYQH